MKIIVPVKQVPATDSVVMDEETGTMVRDGVVSIVNPADLHAVELALQLREKFGGTVTAISMGPAAAKTALKEVISMGCDDAVLLSDRSFAGADTYATAHVLQGAIKKFGDADLVICGERAIDGETGQVGPGVAAMLDWPVATFVGTFDWDASTPEQLKLHRRVEAGQQVLNVPTPAVLTVVREISPPRLPTLAGKRRARDVEIPVWQVSDLDVDVSRLGLKGSPTRVVKIHHPKVTRECKLLHAGDPTSRDAAISELMSFLRERELI
jgi:electron transfer flavoprotein beta subunit